MTIRVHKAGILTTVQDLGRTGSRRFGINPNGVTDSFAARAVNILLNSPENEAVLEMHFPTGEFEFENACSFALGGAEFNAELDGVSIANWTVHQAANGSRLRFTERLLGCRAYLGIRGGIRVDEWLGSSCTNVTAGVGGFHGRKIEKDDQITLSAAAGVGAHKLAPSVVPRYSRFPTVRIVAGPEYDWLTQDSQKHLESESFSVSNNSNRMGYRLIGDALQRVSADEMISSAVTFGTIQLLPDGQLIVLMSDHQTTGGYPRVANVIAVDLPLLAQIGPSDGVGFHMIPHDEAERLFFDLEHEFNLLKVGCRFR